MSFPFDISDGNKGGFFMLITQPCIEKETERYYRIGMFSQMNRVTIKALRHYDEIGLLKPQYVDDHNGYRYYTSNQIPVLHQILALRDIGFSLEEIQQVMNGASEKKLLLRKKGELMMELSDLTKKIAGIESYLAKEEGKEGYRVVMKSLPEVTIASMCICLTGYDALFDYMPQMGYLMEEANCECAVPDYCFTIYYDEEYKEAGDIQVEICQAVTKLQQDVGELKFRTLPSVPLAACVLHKGPYEMLPKAYEAIVQFIEHNGYEIIGHQRESYIDGIWNKEKEEDWLTEIQFPIRKL